MNPENCHIIRDLLPLYIDGVCSRESAELVEEHLASCEACAAVYGEMTARVRPDAAVSAFEEKRIFRGALRSILGIMAALAAMVGCFVINAGGAWMGGPAGVGNLVVTALYVVFWGVFTLVSRKYGPLLRVSFVISLLTFISAANSLVRRLLGGGGFISGFVSVFASVPFYGLRWFMDWTPLYAAATAVSLGWLVCTGAGLRKLRRDLEPSTED